ncbi:60S ribosomal protein L13, partial [Coemansia sp. 'formosensis']
RLKAYQAKLIVLPRNPKQRTAEDLEAYKSAAQSTSQVVPVPAAFVDEAPRAVTAEEKKTRAYVALRQARGVQRSVGKVQKRIAAVKEKKENAKK